MRPIRPRVPAGSLRPAAAALLAGLTLAGTAGCAHQPTVAAARPAGRPADPSGSAAATPTATGTKGHHHRDKATETAPGWEVSAVAGHTGVPDSSPVTCPAATVRVTSAAELTTALGRARPGDVIGLQAGTYAGHFVAAAAGTAAAPIFLCGPAGAVLDGGDTSHGYVLHLDGARYWRLVGFTVRDGQKGVVADRTSHSVIQALTVTDLGDEGIHLRAASTDNVVLDNHVSETGRHSAKYGEGIYIGSARSNWCTYSSCGPDRSDRNVVRGNTITATTAENLDLKEGTTGGEVLDNGFDGTGMTAADSWVDVKGDAWLISGNHGVNAPKDGFQTHQILQGWGDRNLFRDNHADVRASGDGFALTPPLNNVVTCDNTATEAAAGLSNIPCR